MKHYHREQGAIAIYIVLLVLLMVTSAAVILSGVLSRQLRTSLDVVATERAFYAANSGIEEGFARLLQGSDGDDTLVISGQVEYEDGEASFDGRARLTGEATDLQRSACIESQGNFRGRERRIAIAPPAATCEF